MSYATSAEEMKMIECVMSLLEDVNQSGNIGRPMVYGSDEHLDMILDVRKSIPNAAISIGILVNIVERNFNVYTTDQAKEMLVRTFPIFRIAESFRDAIIKSGLQNYVNTQLDIFDSEINDLWEITNDLSRYRLNVRMDYNSLFSEEN